MNICTISAANYLAQARVLADSFLDLHPDGTVHILVVDGTSDEPHRSGVELYDGRSVFPDEADFFRMATMYDVVELATAVKPAFLLHLLRTTGEPVTYLDPDILVLSPLTDVAQQAREHGLVLTPHLLQPMEVAGRYDLNEISIAVAGTYNLGFASVSEIAVPFLEWWDARLRRWCVNQAAAGLMVDQRWVELGFGYFGGRVLRDPGYNVAYWNAEFRKLETSADGRITVNGDSPLRFFHFSGYSPRRPHLLSKWLGERPRVLLSERPDLVAMCEAYRELLERNDFDQRTRAPYGFNTAEDGTAIDGVMRRIYRRELLGFEAGVIADEPPAAWGGENGAFGHWLSEADDPRRDARHLSRYLRALWSERGDLQAAYPDIVGRDASRYSAWARRGGVEPELQLPASSEPPAPGKSRVLEPGVNISGYFRAEYGVGEAARLVVAAVAAADVPYATIGYDRTRARQAHTFQDDGIGAARFDTNIVCVNADQLGNYNHDVGELIRPGRVHIGFWNWELSEFPPELDDAFILVDEVWCGSTFARDAVAARTTKPVHALPLSFEIPDAPAMSRADVGFDDRLTFLFVMDFDSVLERKNPLGLIDAYTRAFPETGQARLVIKTINGEKRPTEIERVRWAIRERPDIDLWDEYVAAEHKSAMIAHCDCYVSLHRSEGIGLTMAEAMARARPVIATSYSGNVDFMDPAVTFAVPWRPSPVPPGAGPYRTGAEWADPDIGVASDLMRQVAANREAAAARGAAAREHLRVNHSPERAAAFVRERLGFWRDRRDAGWVPASYVAPTGPQALLAANQWFVEGGHFPPDHRSGNPVGRLIQRVVRRLLRAPLGRQLQFNANIIQVVNEIAAEHRDVRGVNDPPAK
jgi:glycosyltransferase involved in cell wall biosynthesis